MLHEAEKDKAISLFKFRFCGALTLFLYSCMEDFAAYFSRAGPGTEHCRFDIEYSAFARQFSKG